MVAAIWLCVTAGQEIVAQHLDILDTPMFLVHERNIRPVKDVLPPQPVCYDQNNIARLEFKWGFSLASNVHPWCQGNEQPNRTNDCPSELHIFFLMNEHFGSQFCQTHNVRT